MRAQEWDLGYLAVLKALSETTHDVVCIVLLRLVKTKNFIMVPLVNIASSPYRSEQSFSGGMF